MELPKETIQNTESNVKAALVNYFVVLTLKYVELILSPKEDDFEKSIDLAFDEFHSFIKKSSSEALGMAMEKVEGLIIKVK